MGYAEEKAQVERTRRKWILIVAAVLFAVILALCIFSAFVPVATWKYYFNRPKISAREDGDMRMHFIDVGQGDCTLIELPDGKIMLVDGGDGSAQSEKAIMRYLNALKIKHIDYMVLTHADSDYCGGLATVLKYTRVDKVFVPPVLPTANAAYAKFYKQLNQEGCAVPFVSMETSLSMKDGVNAYTLQFLYPNVYEEPLEDVSDHNLISAVFWLDYCGVSTLFTGDAPLEVENKLMKYDELGLFTQLGVSLGSTEILKVAHHGSDSSTQEEFVRYLHAESAVISCGKDNEYGHPAVAVQSILGRLCDNVYRTDVQGSVVITVHCDGTYSVQTLG